MVVSPNENGRRAEAFCMMLAASPEARHEHGPITHQPNVIAALGKDWFDVTASEASLFRPENGA